MTKLKKFDSAVFLSHVTTRPGVYVMRDRAGVVLYVGKAKNLQNRLRSYFQKQGLSQKTKKLMEAVVDIETTATESEREALILENNLIKNYRPKYNILLRDDKSYPFIRVSEHEFPRLSLHRGARNLGQFFGPYPNVHAVRQALERLQKVFRVRECEDGFFKHRSRPCLQYQIERCYAPCVGLISREDYQQTVQAACDFLSGKTEHLLQEIQEKMLEKSKAQAYEQAAILRNELQELRALTEKQHIVFGKEDCDVLALVEAYGSFCVQVMTYRNGQQIGSVPYFPKMLEFESLPSVMAAFIAQFYYDRPAPNILIINHFIDENARKNLEDYLSEKNKHNVRILHEVRAMRKHWLEMTEENAKLSLNLRLSAKMTMKARFQSLADSFALSLPKRLECVDISHTQGEYTVASCVVFDERGALKKDYRRYKIQGVAAGDDYGAMRELLKRRFERFKKGEGVLPDILFVDGGRGQLRQAIEILEELEISGVQLISVAKGEGRKAGLEKFYFPNEKKARHLPKNSPAMQLIVQIRDEAHRFAITGHRRGRDKKVRHSVLQEIKGIGAKRRANLIKHFGGLQGVRNASREALAAVDGISEALAQEIYAHFHE